MSESGVRVGVVEPRPGMWLGLVVALLVAVTLLPAPAGAQEAGGTVTATVTVADQVCVLIGVEALDFGVLDFDDTATSDAYEVESCSTGQQELFASGTDAVTEGEAVLWTLVPGDATRTIDEYSVDAALDGVGTVWLTSEAASVGVLDAGTTADATHTLATPVVGSGGAGETLSFELVWLATLAD